MHAERKGGGPTWCAWWVVFVRWEATSLVVGAGGLLSNIRKVSASDKIYADFVCSALRLDPQAAKSPTLAPKMGARTTRSGDVVVPRAPWSPWGSTRSHHTALLISESPCSWGTAL